MSTTQTPPGGQPQNIATAIAEVSERAQQLVREEVELAKAEMTAKLTRLARGAAVGAAAGVFVLMAVVTAINGFAWLLYYFLPGGDFTYFWGFFAMAGILVVLAIGAGLLAAQAIKRATPPTPDMAIEEARKIREAVTHPASEVPLAPLSAERPPASGNGAQL